MGKLNQLLDALAAAKAVEQFADTGVIQRKQAAGRGRIAIDFPVSHHHAFALFDESFHIIQRIAQKDANLVRIAFCFIQPAVQMIQDLARAKRRIAVALKEDRLSEDFNPERKANSAVSSSILRISLLAPMVKSEQIIFRFRVLGGVSSKIRISFSYLR